MPAIKLCIFGGGSSYIQEMLGTFARHVASGDLTGSIISLFDIDDENARLMADFGNSVAKAKKLDFKLKVAKTLEEGLEGADFVLSTIRAGGFKQLKNDQQIPLKYGILGQETTGIGGVFMIARQAQAVEQLARTMERVCPRAILINYTNPTGMVTELTLRVSKLNVVGLCDGVIGVKGLVGEVLSGLSYKEAMDIEAYVYGVNHCTWALALYYQGQDLYPLVPKLLEKVDLDVLAKKNYCYADACRLYKYYHLFPGSLYYTRYYYNLNKVIKEFSAPGFTHLSSDLIHQAKVVRSHLRRQIGKEDADFLPLESGYAAHGDQAIGTIHAMACDTREMNIVNVKNRGIICNLSEEAVVEVPAILTRQGALPISMGPLPDSVAGVVQAVDLHCRLAVSAAMTGDKNLVMQAAMAHPANRDFDLMEKCLAEMFEKNKDWLPRFRQ